MNRVVTVMILLFVVVSDKRGGGHRRACEELSQRTRVCPATTRRDEMLGLETAQLTVFTLKHNFFNPKYWKLICWHDLSPKQFLAAFGTRGSVTPLNDAVRSRCDSTVMTWSVLMWVRAGVV